MAKNNEPKISMGEAVDAIVQHNRTIALWIASADNLLDMAALIGQPGFQVEAYQRKCKELRESLPI